MLKLFCVRKDTSYVISIVMAMQSCKYIKTKALFQNECLEFVTVQIYTIDMPFEFITAQMTELCATVTMCTSYVIWCM